MPDWLFSIVVGTGGLTTAALLALALAATRGVPAPGPATRWAFAAVAAHGCHFVEEWASGFYVRFPALLGLAPWPQSFFVGFNVLWILIWLASAAHLRSWPRAAGFAVWFLGIASAANGIVHPALALGTGGYFPGLWTSALAGLAGLALLRALVRPISP